MDNGDIQTWWEIPSIAHFCSLFRVSFNLLDFDIEELEEALLTDGTEDTGSSLLRDLMVRLLRGITANPQVSSSNYQMFLRRLLRRRWEGEEGRSNPFEDDCDFQFLPLRTKVDILYALCDYRLDSDDVADLLKNLESDSLRVEPLGHDDDNNTYWYFYGTRLYREYMKPPEPKPKEKKRGRKKKRGRRKEESEDETEESGVMVWEVICFAEEDWENLTNRFKNTKTKSEKSLYRTLKDDFLPEIPRLFAEKERLKQKRILENPPRRASSRIEKQRQLREEEQRQDTGQRTGKNAGDRSPSRDSICSSFSCDSFENNQNVTHCFKEEETFPDEIPELPTPPSLPPPPPPPPTNTNITTTTKKKLKGSHVYAASEEDLRIGMYKVLEYLKGLEDSWPFLEPVDQEDAPNYYRVIDTPMDLSTMEDKLDAGGYYEMESFNKDFALIVKNCMKYNGYSSEYSEMAEDLEKAFEKAVDKFLNFQTSTDEEIAVEVQQKKHKSKKLKHKKSKGECDEVMEDELETEKRRSSRLKKVEENERETKPKKNRSTSFSEDAKSSDSKRKDEDERRKKEDDRKKKHRVYEDEESEQSSDGRKKKSKGTREDDEPSGGRKKHRKVSYEEVEETTSNGGKKKHKKGTYEEVDDEELFSDGRRTNTRKAFSENIAEDDHRDSRRKKNRKGMYEEMEDEDPPNDGRRRKNRKGVYEEVGEEESISDAKSKKNKKGVYEEVEEKQPPNNARRKNNRKGIYEEVEDDEEPTSDGRRKKNKKGIYEEIEEEESSADGRRKRNRKGPYEEVEEENTPNVGRKKKNRKGVYEGEESMSDSRTKNRKGAYEEVEDESSSDGRKKKNRKGIYEELDEEELSGDGRRKKNRKGTNEEVDEEETSNDRKKKHHRKGAYKDAEEMSTDARRRKHRRGSYEEDESSREGKDRLRKRREERETDSRLQEKNANDSDEDSRSTRRRSETEEPRPRRSSQKTEKEKENVERVAAHKKKRVKTFKATEAIDALAAATEATLKDLNKWLPDDTPKFAEFPETPSTSPTHLPPNPGEPEEEEPRRVVPDKRNRVISKAKKLQNLINRKFRESATMKKERCIDRFQPGKAKGNLLGFGSKPIGKYPVSHLDSAISKLKGSRSPRANYSKEVSPKLNLGAVLTTSEIGSSLKYSLGLQSIRNHEEYKEEPKVEEKKEIEDRKPEIPGKANPTPNLSAWFKAFGIPKKKKMDGNEEKEEPMPPSNEQVQAVETRSACVPSSSLPTPKPASPQIAKPSSPQPVRPISPQAPPPSSPVPPSPEETKRQRNYSSASNTSERSSINCTFEPERSPLYASSESDRSPMWSAEPSPNSYSPHQSPSMTERSQMYGGYILEKNGPRLPMNGAIKVGFYQDASQKSSPESLPMHSPMHSGQSPMHSAHSPLHPSHSPMHPAHSPMQASHSPMHPAHSPMQASHSPMHSAHSPMQTSHSPMHSAHSPMQTSHSPMHSAHSPMHSAHSPMHQQQPSLSPMHPPPSPMHPPPSPMHPAHSPMHSVQSPIHSVHSPMSSQEAMPLAKNDMLRMCAPESKGGSVWCQSSANSSFSPRFVQPSMTSPKADALDPSVALPKPAFGDATSKAPGGEQVVAQEDFYAGKRKQPPDNVNWTQNASLPNKMQRISQDSDPDSPLVITSPGTPPVSTSATNIMSGNMANLSQIVSPATPDAEKDNVDPKFQNMEPKFQNVGPKFPNVEPKFQNVEPKFQNVEPKFQNVEPKFQDMDPKFQSMDPKFQNVDPKFQSVDPKFQSVDPKFQNVDPKFQNVDPKYQNMDPKFQNVDAKFQSIDPKFQSIDPKFQSIEAKFQNIDPKFQNMDPKFQGMDPKFQNMDPKFQNMDPKFQSIDSKFPNIDPKFQNVIQQPPFSSPSAMDFAAKSPQMPKPPENFGPVSDMSMAHQQNEMKQPQPSSMMGPRLSFQPSTPSPMNPGKPDMYPQPMSRFPQPEFVRPPDMNQIVRPMSSSNSKISMMSPPSISHDLSPVGLMSPPGSNRDGLLSSNVSNSMCQPNDLSQYRVPPYPSKQSSEMLSYSRVGVPVCKPSTVSSFISQSSKQGTIPPVTYSRSPDILTPPMSTGNSLYRPQMMPKLDPYMSDFSSGILPLNKQQGRSDVITPDLPSDLAAISRLQGRDGAGAFSRSQNLVVGASRPQDIGSLGLNKAQDLANIGLNRPQDLSKPDSRMNTVPKNNSIPGLSSLNKPSTSPGLFSSPTLGNLIPPDLSRLDPVMPQDLSRLNSPVLGRDGMGKSHGMDYASSLLPQDLSRLVDDSLRSRPQTPQHVPRSTISPFSSGIGSCEVNQKAMLGLMRSQPGLEQNIPVTSASCNFSQGSVDPFSNALLNRSTIGARMPSNQEQQIRMNRSGQDLTKRHMAGYQVPSKAEELMKQNKNSMMGYPMSTSASSQPLSHFASMSMGGLGSRFGAPGWQGVDSLYQQYLARQQEELLLRTASHHSHSAHMMQSLIVYPPNIPSPFQGMNRPSWL